MTLTPQQLSDRIEIQDLLVRYTRAIDGKDWKLLDTCFTPDAHVDYTSSGGVQGAYPEVRAWLEKALALFPVTVHALSNSHVELDGDRARSRTLVTNPMAMDRGQGVQYAFTVHAAYNDDLVRTPQGWRIARRVEETLLMEGALPEGLQVPS